MTADGRPAITWPGVDQQRAAGVCWHLIRAMQLCRRAASSPPGLEVWQRRRMFERASAHLRVAKGWFGAIGFETRRWR